MGKTTNSKGEGNYGTLEAQRPVYNALSDARCRAVLSALDQVDSMHYAALAAAVLSDERGIPVDTVRDADTEPILHELYHIHVPKLEAAGLVSLENGTIETRLAEGSAQVPDVQAFVETDRSRVLQYLKLLAVDDRRQALAVLLATGPGVDLSTLAASVARLRGFSTADPRFDSLCLALHHVHLPMLDQAGLVRYDHEEKTVELASLASTVDESV